MSRIIKKSDLMEGIVPSAITQAISCARYQPKINLRHGGTVVAMVKLTLPHSVELVRGFSTMNTLTPRAIEVAPIFEDGNHQIINSKNEVVNTYAVAMQKIASCEWTVSVGQGFYSGINGMAADANNGFTEYPGAVCYQIATDDRSCFPKSELDSVKIVACPMMDHVPFLELYLAVSGGTAEEDLASALAPRSFIEQVFKNYGYEVTNLGKPPIELGNRNYFSL